MIQLQQVGGGHTYINPHYIVRCWEERGHTTVVMAPDGFETSVLDTPFQIAAKIDELQQGWRDL